MPIDLLSSIKKTSHWAFGSNILNSILGSSIFVALVISLTMILLIMIMYPAKSGTSLTIVCKMFIYMFFITWLVLFLHDSVVRYINEEELEEKESDELANGADPDKRDVIYNNDKQIEPKKEGGAGDNDKGDGDGDGDNDKGDGDVDKGDKGNNNVIQTIRDISHTSIIEGGVEEKLRGKRVVNNIHQRFQL